jgi:heat shock protein 1/8
MVSKFFYWRNLNISINLDEAVAKGAAIYAAVLHGMGGEKIKNILINDAIPNSIGIETTDNRIDFIIRRSTTIPTKKS